MDACQHFFHSFAQQALTLIHDRDQERATQSRRQGWWQEYYEDPDKDDYEMCDYCQCPFVRDDDYRFICVESEVQECKQWCARDGCQSDLDECGGCGYAMCPDHVLTCVSCKVQHCPTCNHEDCND